MRALIMKEFEIEEGMKIEACSGMERPENLPADERQVLKITSIREKFIFAEDIFDGVLHIILFPALWRCYAPVAPVKPQKATFRENLQKWLYMALGLIFKKRHP